MKQKILLINASFLAGVLVCSTVYVGVPALLTKEYFPLASAMAVLLSATIALSSAYYTVTNHNIRTREKNTIDVIHQGKGKIGPEYIYVKDFLKDNENQKHDALIYLARNSAAIKEMRPILDKLNEIEHLCEGIFKGFYDKGIIQDNRGSTVIYIWETLQPYINERRVVQQARMEKHPKFRESEENRPFHWLEKAYELFTNTNEKSDSEIKYLIIANILLFIPCLPAIIELSKLGG